MNNLDVGIKLNRGMKTDINRNARIKLIVDKLFQGHQKTFARLMDVSEPTVSAWINGDHGLRRSTLVRIAQTLKGRVNERWLVDGLGESGLDKPVNANSQQQVKQVPQPAVAEANEEHKFRSEVIEPARRMAQETSDELKESRDEFFKILADMFSFGRRKGYIP